MNDSDVKQQPAILEGYRASGHYTIPLYSRFYPIVGKLVRYILKKYILVSPDFQIILRGRKPKKGKKYGMGGGLKLEDAKRYALYVKVNYTYWTR